VKHSIKNILAITISMITLFAINNSTLAAEASKDIFMISTTSKSMDEVVSAVKSHVKKKKWVYLGDFKVKKGQVILVKFCIKSAGKIAWKAGLKVSAMLPCGNMGIYQKDGKTEISVLNPNYMNTLYPDANLKAAGELLIPLYKEMTAEILK